MCVGCKVVLMGNDHLGTGNAVLCLFSSRLRLTLLALALGFFRREPLSLGLLLLKLCQPLVLKCGLVLVKPPMIHLILEGAIVLEFLLLCVLLRLQSLVERPLVVRVELVLLGSRRRLAVVALVELLCGKLTGRGKTRRDAARLYGG